MNGKWKRGVVGVLAAAALGFGCSDAPRADEGGDDLSGGPAEERGTGGAGVESGDREALGGDLREGQGAPAQEELSGGGEQDGRKSEGDDRQ